MTRSTPSRLLPALLLSLAGLTSASPEDSIAWQQQNSGSQTLWAVFFTDSLHGWAGGDGWTLYRTTNGGANWTQLPQFGTDSIYALSFENDSTGWATTGSGRIYHTADSGKTWTQSYFRRGWITGLLFHGRDTGWACGSAKRGALNIYDPVIYRTFNAGTTWDSVGVSGPYSLETVRSPDGKKVFVAGFNYLTHSNDAGNAFWPPVYFPSVSDTQFANSTGYINVVDFTTPAIGFGVGRYGHIMKTSDSGASWRTVIPHNWIWLEDIRFAGVAKGVIAGERGAVLSTADSGASWTLRYPLFPPTLNASWFRALYPVDSAHIWMVGDNGLIAKGSFPSAPVGIFRGVGREKNSSFTLDPVSPGRLRIRCSLRSGGEVDIILSDIRGNVLRRKNLGRQLSGAREIVWDLGSVPAPGIYCAQLRLNGKTAIARRIAFFR